MRFLSHKCSYHMSLNKNVYEYSIAINDCVYAVQFEPVTKHIKNHLEVFE